MIPEKIFLYCDEKSGGTFMTLEWLHEFCQAAKMQNITKAADYCYISQSSLSRHIAELEKELNVRLVDRDNRNFSLTEAGQYFYEECQALLQRLETIRLRTQQIGLGQTGQLRIASFCSYIPYIYEKVFSFRKQHPEILCSVNYVENVISSALNPGIADLGVVFSFEVPETDELETKVLGQDDICLITPMNHRLATSNSVAMSSVRGENLLLLSGLRYPFLGAIQDTIMHGPNGNIHTGNTTYEVENLETMILHTRFGDGVALLPRVLAQERAGGCAILSINDLDVRYDLCMCWRRDNSNSALQQFLRHYDEA
jgi:DNA-binding transcriptional LysR family regulator